MFTSTSATTSSPWTFTPSPLSTHSLPSTNLAVEADEDEPPGLCAYDSYDEDGLSDTSSTTTPPTKPHTFAVKAILPPSYAISFSPV